MGWGLREPSFSYGFLKTMQIPFLDQSWIAIVIDIWRSCLLSSSIGFSVIDIFRRPADLIDFDKGGYRQFIWSCPWWNSLLICGNVLRRIVRYWSQNLCYWSYVMVWSGLWRTDVVLSLNMLTPVINVSLITLFVSYHILISSSLTFLELMRSTTVGADVECELRSIFCIQCLPTCGLIRWSETRLLEWPSLS